MRIARQTLIGDINYSAQINWAKSSCIGWTKIWFGAHSITEMAGCRVTNGAGEREKYGV